MILEQNKDKIYYTIKRNIYSMKPDDFQFNQRNLSAILQAKIKLNIPLNQFAKKKKMIT